jgi:hypothetical protein
MVIKHFPALVVHPRISSRGRTYDSPMGGGFVASRVHSSGNDQKWRPNTSAATTRVNIHNIPPDNGYTENHLHFNSEDQKWHGRASAAGNLKDVVSVRVQMGTIRPGRSRIFMIGVRICEQQLCFYMLINCPQTCIEGVNNLDPHIGGDKLHRVCYEAVLPHWDQWSGGHGGYKIPLTQTTLRGIKIHAPIAGKDYRGPVKNRDAIWEFFFKKRGKSTMATFRAVELELAIVIDFEDFKCAEKRRNRMYNIGLPDSNSDSDNDIITTSKVRKLLFICAYITHVHLLAHWQWTDGRGKSTKYQHRRLRVQLCTLSRY